MNFVIGDVHGEAAKLRALMDTILKLDASPTPVFIGDYLDKGEDPWRALEAVREIDAAYPCVLLKGNHEYYWLGLDPAKPDIEKYLRKYGAGATIASAGRGDDIYRAREALLGAFPDLWGRMALHHDMGDFLAVHSGIPPAHFQDPIESIPEEKLLFTRYPFLMHPARYFGKTVIFGHTGFLSPYHDGYKIGVDTAACFLEAQPLTAFCPERRLFADSSGRAYALDDIPLDRCPVIPRVKPWRYARDPGAGAGKD